jgi:hypothetical protein
MADEFKDWLRFGLEPANRGHDGVATPIIDANSLVFFLRFVGYASKVIATCGRCWSSARWR